MSGNHKDIKPDTKLVTGGRRDEWTQRIVNPPVWRASTILYDNVEDLRNASVGDTRHKLTYGRKGTPTHWALADALTELEPDAEGTMLYPSGLAAIACALLTVLKPGDELLMVDSAYDPTRCFCDGLLKTIGVRTTYYDPMIGAGIETLIGPDTRAIFMESPGSLTFEVQDVPAIIAVAKAHGLITFIDNTWATPLLMPVIGMGVDYSIMACTKYVVGHSDVLMGSVTAAKGRFDALRDMTHQMGQTTSPDDAWLAMRGLRTMGARLKQQGASALTIAKWLAEQSEVARVLHPALEGCPGHEFHTRDFKGSSSLFSIVMNGGGDAARAAMINGLELFGIGFSWGGYESLALPIEPRRHRTATTWDVEGPAIRIHIGLEDPDDLIADLSAGLARYRKEAT